MRTFVAVLGLLVAALPALPALPVDASCPASSRAFTGAPVDAPFFVFDGGSRGAGLGQYDSPAAIAMLLEGWRTLVAVADGGNHRILVMTELGFFQDYFGGQGKKPGFLVSPAGLAMSPEGDLWVADAGNHRIQKLRALREDITAVLGQPLAVVGRRGSRPGELESPAGLAVDSRGNLYVADRGNHRIQKLSPQGKPLAAWGSRGAEPGHFESPAGIAVGPKDLVYVADTGNHRVQVFDASGRLLRTWGSRGKGAGQLESPQGVAVDAAGRVYVADTGNDRIQKFDPSGRALATAGCPGTKSGELRRPVAVALDRDGYLYVVDAGNHRIQKLGPP
jgi:DNA-binding beta-propeller fold protein YncE